MRHNLGVSWMKGLAILVVASAIFPVLTSMLGDFIFLLIYFALPLFAFVLVFLGIKFVFK